MPAIVSVFVGVLALAADAEAQSFGPHEVVVMVYAGLDRDMDDADAVRVVRQVNAVLQRDDDGPGIDVACEVEFEKVGDIVRFEDEANGIIESAEDFRRINGLAGGNVKVVNTINWCFGLGTFEGCAEGKSFVVTSDHEAENVGMVWGHEMGHNVGLGHSTEDGMVMSAGEELLGPRVTQSECESFRVGR